MKDIYGLFLPELEELFASFDAPKFRARQAAEWLYRRGVCDFKSMVNLPAVLREILAAELTIGGIREAARQTSADDSTVKCLLEYDDGAAVETVLMRQSYGNSVCVSSQVGCGMGCVFCASTLHGVARNLTGGEIFRQTAFFQSMLEAEGGKVDTVVIMGSGEPLMNYENVVRFIRLCHEPYSLNMGLRNFTLSTSGIVPGIDRLAQEGMPITLAISLHASNDELRSQLMPVNRRYPLRDVLQAADRYAEKTGRRVTYEYILLAGKNDSPADARQLAQMLKGRLANINLIPANPVPERGLHRPDAQHIQQFECILTASGVNATVRREMGADIQAACGQLRRQQLEKCPHI